MSNLIKQLWADDCGALIAAEYLFVATILVIGIVTGLTAVRNAVVSELEELANAYLSLSQGYTVSGLIGCCSQVQGSATIDTPNLVQESVCTANFIPSVIDTLPCN